MLEEADAELQEIHRLILVARSQKIDAEELARAADVSRERIEQVWS